MLDNFLSVGIDPNDIHVVVGIQKHIGLWWNKLIEKYEGVQFFFYRDLRRRKKYSPSIRPHILSEHWYRFPELEKDTIFYHDCDILFTRSPNFGNLLTDNIWYLSDTRSYIGAEYVKSKGKHIFESMCSILGIDKSIPEINEEVSGGAQHILKHVSSIFWKDVEYYSEELYQYLSSIDSDIQKWTSDMWALLWTAWKYGYETKIDSYLDFSMATDTWPKWNNKLIYHNAGAVPEHEGILFRKDSYRDKLPYSEKNPYDKQFCSKIYFDHVIETGKNCCLKEEEPDLQNLIDQCKSIFIYK